MERFTSWDPLRSPPEAPQSSLDDGRRGNGRGRCLDLARMDPGARLVYMGVAPHLTPPHPTKTKLRNRDIDFGSHKNPRQI